MNIKRVRRNLCDHRKSKIEHCTVRNSYNLQFFRNTTSFRDSYPVRAHLMGFIWISGDVYVKTSDRRGKHVRATTNTDTRMVQQQMNGVFCVVRAEGL
jgi:hypothetical protein